MVEKPSWYVGQEFENPDDPTAPVLVWAGPKRGAIPKTDFLNMQGESQEQFNRYQALYRRLQDAEKLSQKPMTTGFWGGVLSGQDAPEWSPLKGIGGTDAYNLRARLEPFRNVAAVENIATMRQNSPNGSALGNTSNADMELLKGLDANVDIKQSAPQLREEIARAQQYLTTRKKGLTAQNPFDLRQDDAVAIPDGALWRDTQGNIFRQQKGAGYRAPPPKKGASAYMSALRGGQIDRSRPYGTPENPYLARSVEQANRLPKGSYVFLPDGSLARVK